MDRKWDLRKTSYLAVVLFLISLIPVLLVLPCVYPQADDFSYGREIYAVWRSGHSAWSVFLQAFATVKRYYTTWQGTYTSIFLMALMPASFSMAAYHAVPLVMIALLTVSLYCLLRELLSGWFEMPGWFVCGVTAVLAFAMIQGMPDKTEAFTWYNAAIHYTGMESLWMFYMASLFAAMRKNRAGRKTAPVLLSCALAFLAAGGNNITVLFALLADALLLIFLLIFRKRYGQYFRPALPSAVCLAAGAAANFLAPGNMQRLLYSGGNDCSAPLTVLRALETGALKAVRWCDGLTVMTVVLLLPFVWYLVRTPQIRRYRFPLPGLVAFFSWGLYSAQFAPDIFVNGSAGILRTQNAMRINYFLLLFLNTVYLSGWILRISGENAGSRKTEERIVQRPGRFYAAALPCFAVVLAVQMAMNPTCFTSSAAAVDLLNGTAVRYAETIRYDLAILEGSDREVMLRKPDCQPSILYTEEADEWRAGTQKYYGKDNVSWR